MKLTIGNPMTNPVQEDLGIIVDWKTKTNVGFTQQLHQAWSAIKAQQSRPGEFEVFIPRAFAIEPSAAYADPRPDQPAVFHNGQLKGLEEVLIAAATGTLLPDYVAPGDLPRLDGLRIALAAEKSLQYECTGASIKPQGLTLKFNVPAAAAAVDRFES